MPRGMQTARIVGHGMTRLGKLGKSATALMEEALEKALATSGLRLQDLDGLVAVPSLSDPHFMEAHYLATRVGLLPSARGVRVRTIDTGGAGPVSALLTAARMVKHERCNAVAVIAGDAVSSLPTPEFLRRADQGCRDPSGALPSPCIPHGYDRIARWVMDKYGVTREQLAMVSVLMSRQARLHPNALTRQPHSLEEVLGSKPIAPATNLLECARRADGGAAFIVANSIALEGASKPGLGPLAKQGGAVVLGGGEASGPLFPPPVIDESMFSCEMAAKQAYSEAQLLPSDIDWFGIYDCYPVCFLRAVAACGLAKKGMAGQWVQQMFERTQSLNYTPEEFPVNTHGGLLAFGAPWEVPAMYNIIEACEQLSGSAAERQVKGARRALVYGNGGIFSHSAVAILSTPVD
eukprot:TRINITY_DN23394_c0_g1_i1.p1 TRINITY_DN23394_c0_g1~~TRINITY_DN23394_c0_g1_i1.p1  ORF type:complete len:407 (+),score=65.93 TRINITY_DN23394_c0_g1_i1:66-1286(+)